MKESNVSLIDIYGIIYQPWWRSKEFYVTIVALVCSFCVFSVYYLYRKGFFKKKLSFDKQALYDLAMLLKQENGTTDQIKDAYFHLTMILKTYLAQRYQILLYDKSDTELMVMIQSKISSDQAAVLSDFWQRAFAVKFALAHAAKADLLRDIAAVQTLIKDTMKTFDKMEHS
jgi:hypothetical protein